MELSILGKDLLGEYEAKILFLLNRSASSMSGRQISRTIAAPNSTIQRILSRFEKIGLLQTDPHPGIVLYSLNKKHLLYKSIVTLFQVRKDFLDSVNELFAGLVGETGSLVLHGLTAKHESSNDDDVDLYLVIPDILDDEVLPTLPEPDDEDDDEMPSYNPGAVPTTLNYEDEPVDIPEPEINATSRFMDALETAVRKLEKRIGNRVNLLMIDETAFKNRIRIKDAQLMVVLTEGRDIVGRSLVEWAKEYGWKPPKAR